MFELVEGTGRYDWNFKTFVHHDTFQEFLDRVKEEANYWQGYGSYFRKLIRPDEFPEELAEGLALVKRATNLRQAVYSDEKVLAGLADKFPVYAEYEKQRIKIENRVVVKAYDIVRLRQDFLYFMDNMEGIEPRRKYSARIET